MIPHIMLATLEVDNHKDCSESGKMASSFTEHVLREISSLILSREAPKQLAFSMVTGRPHVSLYCNENLGGDHYRDFSEVGGCFPESHCSSHDYQPQA